MFIAKYNLHYYDPFPRHLKNNLPSQPDYNRAE